MLVEAGANIEICNTHNDSPLSLVAENLNKSSSLEIIKILQSVEKKDTDQIKMAGMLKKNAQKYLKEG